MSLFSDDLRLDVSRITVVTCHRLSPKYSRSSRDRPRDIIARFASHDSKKYVLFAARKLKGRNKPIYINEQFPFEIDQQRRILRPIMMKAKGLKMKATLAQERLIIDGKAYTVDTINDIPFDSSDLATKLSDSHLLFSGRLAPFSNFHASSFTLDGRSFNCNEQFYQCMKAKFYSDDAAAMAIMLENNPLEMKRIGDSLTGDRTKWDLEAPTVMEKGVFAKFSQNPKLASALRATGNRRICECIPRDLVWGNGLRLSDPKASDETCWPGKNILGQLLEQVRSKIM